MVRSEKTLTSTSYNLFKFKLLVRRLSHAILPINVLPLPAAYAVEVSSLMPATNAHSVRSFSALHRLKTWLPTTTDQVQLNWCMTAHIHSGQYNRNLTRHSSTVGLALSGAHTQPHTVSHMERVEDLVISSQAVCSGSEWPWESERSSITAQRGLAGKQWG